MNSNTSSSVSHSPNILTSHSNQTYISLYLYLIPVSIYFYFSRNANPPTMQACVKGESVIPRYSLPFCWLLNFLGWLYIIEWFKVEHPSFVSTFLVLFFILEFYCYCCCCVCVLVMHAVTCVCGHVEARRLPWVSFFRKHYLPWVFEREIFHWSGSWQHSLGCLATETKEAAWLCLPGALMIMSLSYNAQASFMWVLDDQSRVL